MHESESQDSPIHQTGTKRKFESERRFESKRGSASMFESEIQNSQIHQT